MNKVQLIGNVGSDPEVRTLQNGNKVCNFNLATSQRWKDKASGERKERTEWHRIVIFNQSLVSLAGEYIKKGSKIYVEGQLETRKWQDEQKKDRYATEVVLKSFNSQIELLDKKPAAAPAEQAPPKDEAPPATDFVEDDIPF